MPKIGGPCPHCGAPLRRAVRTMTDNRSTVCTNPECERYSSKPGVGTRSQQHCPVANIRPLIIDWSVYQEESGGGRPTGQTTLEVFG